MNVRTKDRMRVRAGELFEQLRLDERWAVYNGVVTWAEVLFEGDERRVTPEIERLLDAELHQWVGVV